MIDVLPFVVVGITGGLSYALLALGLVLINKSSRFLSFAQAEMGTFSTLVVASLVYSHGLPWLVALPAGVAVGAAMGVVARALLLGRGAAGKLPPLVGTIAILLLLVVVELKLFTSETEGSVRQFPSPMRGKGITIFDVVISPTQLVVVGAVAVTCVALWYLIERTAVGLTLRAGADNAQAATIVGLRPARIDSLAWAVAGGLAALSGVFLGWVSQQIAPGFLTFALPKAFTAAIIGGMTSLPGAVVGGLVVGLAESLSRKFFGTTPGAPELVVFLLLFLTLLVRPQGLLGKRSRVLSTEASESLVSLHDLVTIPRLRPAAVSDALRRALPAPAVVAAGLLAVLVLPSFDAYKLSVVPIYVILALSLNSLIASTGQVSLAHVALMGFGAFMTAVAASTWELPFALAFASGALSSAAAAFLLGIAALRIRGLYLAVLSLSFAVVLETFVFPRPEFSKGGAGIGVSRPELGPFDLADERTFLAAALAAMALMWLADRRILASPLGRAWVALRENETAAMARGVSGAPLRVAAFTLSGLWAGVAGGLYAYRSGHLVAASFPLLLSFNVILFVVLGGIGVRWGVALQTALFIALPIYLEGAGDWLVLAGSAVLVLIIGLHPEGLGGQIRAALRERRHHRPAGEVDVGLAGNP